MGLQLSFGNGILSNNQKTIPEQNHLEFPWALTAQVACCGCQHGLSRNTAKPSGAQDPERPNFHPRFDYKISQILQHGPFWAVRIGWTSPHFEWCPKLPARNKPGACDVPRAYLKLIQTATFYILHPVPVLQSLSVLWATADSIFPTPANCQSTAIAISIASPEILWDDLVSMKASNPSWNSDLVMIPSCKIQLATGSRAIKKVVLDQILDTCLCIALEGIQSTGIKQLLRHVDLWMHSLEGWKTQNPIRPRWGPNVRRVLQLALPSGHCFAHGSANSPEVPSITGKNLVKRPPWKEFAGKNK